MKRILFGELLSQGITFVAEKRGVPLSAIIAAIAESTGSSPSAVENWRRGHIPPKEVVARLARYFSQHGAAGEAWLQQFLKEAGFPEHDQLAEGLLPGFFGLGRGTKLLHNLPQPLGLFVGRAREVRQLRRYLDPSSRAWLGVITGMGGVGKTALALEVAHSLLREGEQSYYQVVVWYAVRESSHLGDLLDTIALVVARPHIVYLPVEQKAIEIQGLLSSQPMLLVLDNFELAADDHIADFLRNIPAPTKALVTSRSGAYFLLGSAVLELAGLSDEEAKELARYHALRLGISHLDDSELSRLVHTTAGHPLAIRYALGQVAYSGRALDSVMEVLHGGRGEFFDDVFRASWQLLNEDARRIAMALSIYEEPVSKSLIKSASGISGFAVDSALEQLIATSLVETTPDPEDADRLYLMHPLTRAFIDMHVLPGAPRDRKALLEARDWLKRLEGILYDFTQTIAPSSQQTRSLVDLLEARLGFNEPPNLPPVAYHDFYVLFADVSSAFTELNLPGILPFVFCPPAAVDPKGYESLHTLLSQKLGINVRIAVIVAPFENVLLDRFRDRVCKKIEAVYAYDLVVVDRRDLMRILGAQDPHRILRQVLLSQVNLEIVSPFILTGPAPARMFFGREHELREITEHAAVTSYAVIGGRRIGKTSVLRRLEQIQLPAAGFRALYHDCAFTPTQADFVQAVLGNESWFPQPPAGPPATFGEILQGCAGGDPLVMLLDEADKLIEPDRHAGYPLFSTLRAMANEGTCQFVFSGEQTLRIELLNPSSPLYNLANEMLIGCLDFRAVEELVTRPMKQMEIELKDEEEMVRRIWGFTSGHPNVVQRLCQRLIARLSQQGDRRLSLDDCDAIAADPDFLRRDFLDVYWERATALERICSLVMAADGAARTLTSLAKALSERGIEPSLNETDDALERLVDLRNILKRTPEGYEFAVTAFPEVIAQTARLNDWIALDREVFEKYGDVEPRSKRGIS